MPHQWPQFKNIFILKCHLLLFYTTTMNNLSIRFWHATKSGFYTTTGKDQLNGWTKNFQSPSQSPTCATVWWSEPVWCATASESQWKHYIWKVHSANWWDALKAAMLVVGIGLQKKPNSSSWQHSTAWCTTNASKVEQIGLQTFVSSATFAWPLANWLPLLQTSERLFADKRLSQPAEDRKYFPRVSLNPEARIFMLQE